MKEKEINWTSVNNSIGFDQGWQYPAVTERWAFECAKYKMFSKANFFQLIFFPWATLIDLQRKGRWIEYEYYNVALNKAPPKKTLIRATVCQHIYALDILNLMKRLGITDLYWPHAVLGVNKIDGIRIHPFPLYPVACASECTKLLSHQIIYSRPYLYSFIGSYEPTLYLTSVRKWIFDLPVGNDVYIKKEKVGILKKMFMASKFMANDWIQLNDICSANMLLSTEMYYLNLYLAYVPQDLGRIAFVSGNPWDLVVSQ